MKLESEDLVPYLPYELKIKVGVTSIATLTSNKTTAETINIDYCLTNSAWKPILKPLSEYVNYEDILDEFSVHSEEMFKEHFFSILSPTLNRFDSVNYTIMKLFFKHHLDIFGLIKKGLVIDMNTLKDDT